MQVLAFNFLSKITRANQCFSHLKAHLPGSRVKVLDKILKARCRLAKLELQLQFYQLCLNQGQVPQDVSRKIANGKLNATPGICEKYLQAEIEDCSGKMDNARNFLRSHKDAVYSLPFTLFIRFSKFSSQSVNNCRQQFKIVFDSKLKDSISMFQAGFYPSPIDRHIYNFSSYNFDTVEKQALCRGLNFCVPPKVRQPEVDAEFENLFRQLHTTVGIEEHFSKLKAEFVSISKDFSTKHNSPCSLTKNHFKALNSLRKNDSIVICKPDKGNAVVILDKTAYVEKMNQILNDGSKFSVDEFNIDLTQKIEKQVNGAIADLTKCNLITQKEAKHLKTQGSTIPRMYGLPKTHKDGMPLRPILSMTNAPTFKLAQWLTNILAPVREAVSQHTLQDSFDFVNKIRTIDFTDKVFCSVDVMSLFTNVPLHQTIDFIGTICEKFNITLPLSFDCLKSLILLCTENVQFSFDGQFFFQKDGVAMGSPLGPVLADIFMGFFENFLIDKQCMPVHYFRFVDDSFAVANNISEIQRFLSVINNTHDNLHFTLELPTSDSIPFLDVLVKVNQGSLSTSVYRKPTWSGLYLHFFSHVPVSYKRNLVFNLFNRARRLCSPETLDNEFDILFQALQSNGYPSSFIEQYSRERISQTVFGPAKKPAFISLPFVSDSFHTQVKQRICSVIALAFPVIEPRVVAITRRIPVRSLKDPLPTACASNLIYKFDCSCGSSYVGRTGRWLSTRVHEHLPAWLLKGGHQRPRSATAPSSAITRHACSCAAFDRTRKPTDYFSVLSRARHPVCLPSLEAVFILARKPDLCIMKDFVMSLALPWT